MPNLNQNRFSRFNTRLVSPFSIFSSDSSLDDGGIEGTVARLETASKPKEYIFLNICSLVSPPLLSFSVPGALSIMEFDITSFSHV